MAACTVLMEDRAGHHAQLAHIFEWLGIELLDQSHNHLHSKTALSKFNRTIL